MHASSSCHGSCPHSTGALALGSSSRSLWSVWLPILYLSHTMCRRPPADGAGGHGAPAVRRARPRPRLMPTLLVRNAHAGAGHGAALKAHHGRGGLMDTSLCRRQRTPVCAPAPQPSAPLPAFPRQRTQVMVHEGPCDDQLAAERQHWVVGFEVRQGAREVAGQGDVACSCEACERDARTHARTPRAVGGGCSTSPVLALGWGAG